MSFFLLQSIFLILLCFVAGYLIARFIKRKLCGRAARKAEFATSSNVVRGIPDATDVRLVGIGNSMEFSAKIKPNNLQIIEGIGPKMESVLNENGIATWSQLAAKSVSELQQVLEKYGNRYQIIDPTIWLEQARLAAKGEVTELIKLQKIDGVSKLENMMNQGSKSGYAKFNQDDLKIVEGIGPKIEALLNIAGINTWRQLAQAEPAAIKAILRAAGPRYRLASPESWSLQARLADNGEWGKLRQLQDKLIDIRPSRSAHVIAEVD